MPFGPETVIGTSVLPFGARDQSTRTVARTCLPTRPAFGVTLTHGAAGLTV